jgi:hypothetical protein
MILLMSNNENIINVCLREPSSLIAECFNSKQCLTKSVKFIYFGSAQKQPNNYKNTIKVCFQLVVGNCQLVVGNYVLVVGNCLLVVGNCVLVVGNYLLVVGNCRLLTVVDGSCRLLSVVVGN